MTYNGIQNFNDKCRYILLKYIDDERTPAQAEEQIRLSKMYGSNYDAPKIISELIGWEFLASRCEDPMEDEKDEDIYTTEAGVEALNNERFPSEYIEKKKRQRYNVVTVILAVITALGGTNWKWIKNILKTIVELINK